MALTRTVSNRIEGHLSLLQKVISTSARAILPVYRTTPISALYREAGLLPLEVELDSRSRMATLHTHRFDTRHPLKRRVSWVQTREIRVSRFSGWALNFPKTENIDPLVQPPWSAKENWHASIRRVTNFSHRLPAGIPFQDLVAYSDGGLRETDSGPRVGGGVVIYQAGHIVSRKYIPLSSSLTVFDAEVNAALQAVTMALQLSSARFANNLWSLIDNLYAARQPRNGPSLLFSRSIHQICQYHI